MLNLMRQIGIIMRHYLADQEQIISKKFIVRNEVYNNFFLFFLSLISIEGYHRYLNRYSYC